MAGKRRRRHFIRSGFIAVLGLGFAGAVYGELVRPRLEWLHPPGMISLVTVSPAPLGNVALARFLEAGPETARASGVPGRLLLAEPAFVSVELMSGKSSGEAPISESVVAGNSEVGASSGVGPAKFGAGSARGLAGGISKLGRIARALAASQSRHHSKQSASSSSASGTKSTAGPDQRDNQGNEGSRDQDDADDDSHAGSNPLEVTVTPEPATLWLVSGGMIALTIAGLLRRSRRIS